MPFSPTLSRVLDHGLREYLWIFGYLYVCFSALLLYKTTILRGHGIEFVPLGLAAGKALLLAKFMLIGRKMHIAERFSGSLRRVIALRSGVFFLLLLALTALEQALVGIRRERAIAGVFQHTTGRVGEILAECVLLLLILLPYFAYTELDRSLGEGSLRELLRRRA